MRTPRLAAVALLAALLGPTAVPAPNEAAGAKEAGVKHLFNGKDLSNWDTYLSRPNKASEVPGLKKNEKGEYAEEIGLNKDPLKVFTVVEVEGKPAIRISGEVFGALTSKEEYENYHLKLEFKWGQKKWPPREKAVRDSGLLYHCYGPHGAGGGGWMKSLECQIQEHDCGDFWSVGGGPSVDVEGERTAEKGPITFQKGGQRFTNIRQRIIKSVENDKPGEWNTIEVYLVGKTCVHVVNGKVNMILTNPRATIDGKEQPLTRGKFQIQSEGAEVFYRNITVRPIEAIPAKLVK